MRRRSRVASPGRNRWQALPRAGPARTPPRWPSRRGDYVSTLKRLVAPGGFFFLKRFSVQQPGDQGPYKFTLEELREIFGG
ncbi:hypothetical protein WME94_50525 [Sorangium sp. So ce429]